MSGSSSFVVHGTAPSQIPFGERTVPHLLARQAERYGNKPLLRFGAFTSSYAQMHDYAARHAATLAAAGVVRGDRVLLMSNNRREMLDFFVACAWLGAIFTPINSALRGEQLRHVISNADPKLIVIERDLLEHLTRVEVATPALKTLWVFEHDHEVAMSWNGIATQALPRSSDAISCSEVTPGDPLTIIYTSGTTGPSKGVICPHAQFQWWAHYGCRYLGITEKDVLFTMLPLFHTNALSAFMQALLAGATIAMETRFSASKYWTQVRETGATVLYLLGVMAHILLDRPDHEYVADHRARIALSPATSASIVMQFADRFGVQLIDGYGSTETNHVMSSNLGGFVPGTMGRAAAEFEVLIADDEDRPVPDGTPGELLIRNREPFSMALGYFAMPEATVAAWRNLWFHTGDRALRRPDGVFQFVDRKKEAIRRRGENISSHEVEQALITFDDVAAAAVVGVESNLGEEEVMAFVQLKRGKSPSPEAIIRHLEPRLAYFAIPRYIEFVDELPLTENGKVRKYLLKERGVGQTTWDRESGGVKLAR